MREDSSLLRVSEVRVSGAKVILTLARARPSPGTTVTVSYAPPSGSRRAARPFREPGSGVQQRIGDERIALDHDTVRAEYGSRGRPVHIHGDAQRGLDEETFVLVTVTDSAFPDTPAGAYERNNGPGGRIVEFNPGERSATGTMTPAFDGARPSARTLRVTLATAHVDLGEANGERNYRVAAPDTLTPRVRDRDAALRVADARVRESPDAKLEFRVTLDRSLPGSMEVDYATSDGTATAGEDYTATSGTLAFAAGRDLEDGCGAGAR